MNPIGAVGSGSTLFVKKASEKFQQTTKSDNFCCDFGALRVNVFIKIHVLSCQPRVTVM